jgi:hypothetical protein
VLEEIMGGLMFELPEMDNNGVEYIIDESAVVKPRPLADLRAGRAA